MKGYQVWKLKKIVKGYLKDLAITPQYAGYYYIITAMEMLSDNPFILTTAITKQLYPMIANTYNVSVVSVARLIKHIIFVSRKTVTNKVAVDYFGGLSCRYMDGTMNNGEFLGSLLARLEEEKA